MRVPYLMGLDWCDSRYGTGFLRRVVEEALKRCRHDYSHCCYGCLVPAYLLGIWPTCVEGSTALQEDIQVVLPAGLT